MERISLRSTQCLPAGPQHVSGQAVTACCPRPVCSGQTSRGSRAETFTPRMLADIHLVRRWGRRTNGPCGFSNTLGETLLTSLSSRVDTIQTRTKSNINVKPISMPGCFRSMNDPEAIVWPTGRPGKLWGSNAVGGYPGTYYSTTSRGGGRWIQEIVTFSGTWGMSTSTVMESAGQNRYHRHRCGIPMLPDVGMSHHRTFIQYDNRDHHHHGRGTCPVHGTQCVCHRPVQVPHSRAHPRVARPS